MNTNPSYLTRLAAPAAMAAAAILGMSGIIRLTHEQSGESTTIGIEHLYLGGLTASLVLLVPLVLLLGRVAGRPKLARVAVAGQLALGALTVVSNVNGKDPSFFAAVAVPANLLWFGGFAALGVALKRGGQVAPAVAIGLPLAWALTLPGSAVGGMIVAGAYYLVVGWLVAHGELVRRPGAAPRDAAIARAA